MVSKNDLFSQPNYCPELAAANVVQKDMSWQQE